MGRGGKTIEAKRGDKLSSNPNMRNSGCNSRFFGSVLNGMNRSFGTIIRPPFVSESDEQGTSRPTLRLCNSEQARLRAEVIVVVDSTEHQRVGIERTIRQTNVCRHTYGGKNAADELRLIANWKRSTEQDRETVSRDTQTDEETYRQGWKEALSAGVEMESWNLIKSELILSHDLRAPLSNWTRHQCGSGHKHPVVRSCRNTRGQRNRKWLIRLKVFDCRTDVK